MRTSLALGLALCVVGCGGEDPIIVPDPPDPTPSGPGPVTTVSVSPPNPALTSIGQVVQLSARAADATGSTVPDAAFTWTSVDETVATVGPSGEVTARAAGSATIRATADGVTGSAVVSVDQKPATVAVDPVAQPLTHVGDSVQLVAAVFDGNGVEIPGKPVAWTSSDPAIASVTATGLVTAVADGTVTVTATSDSASAGTAVTVGQVPERMDFSVQPPDRRVGLPMTVEARVLDAGGTPVRQATGPLTLAIGNNPGGGVLAGTTALEPDSGVATFNDISVDQVGSAYTLVASWGSLADVESEAFRVADCPCAYIASSSTRNIVTVVEVETNTLVDTIGVGSGPRGIAITPDNRYAYVSSATGLTVSVIDLAVDEVVDVIDNNGNGPAGIAVSPDGSLVYAVNRFPSFFGSVSVIDTGTGSVTGTIGVGSEPLDVAFTPDGAYAYVTNGGSNSVSVIDVAGGSVTTTVGVGGGAWNIAMSPTQDLAYVGTNDPGTVAVLETAGHSGVTSTSLGALYVYADVAVTPDGAFVYASGDDEIVVLETTGNTVATRIPVSPQPSQIALTPDGSLAYVSHGGSPWTSTISVIDVGTNTVSTTFTVEGAASAVVIRP